MVNNIVIYKSLRNCEDQVCELGCSNSSEASPVYVELTDECDNNYWVAWALDSQLTMMQFLI